MIDIFWLYWFLNRITLKIKLKNRSIRQVFGAINILENIVVVQPGGLIPGPIKEGGHFSQTRRWEFYGIGSDRIGSSRVIATSAPLFPSKVSFFPSQSRDADRTCPSFWLRSNSRVFYVLHRFFFFPYT